MEPEKEKPKENEQSLVKLYSELTGASEATARAVVIHVEDQKAEQTAAPEKKAQDDKAKS